MIYTAMLSDADEIMEFIEREWKQNHILSKNKDHERVLTSKGELESKLKQLKNEKNVISKIDIS